MVYLWFKPRAQLLPPPAMVTTRRRCQRNSELLGRRVPKHLGALAAVLGLAELRREQLGATARVQEDGTGPGEDRIGVICQ